MTCFSIHGGHLTSHFRSRKLIFVCDVHDPFYLINFPFFFLSMAPVCNHFRSFRFTDTRKRHWNGHNGMPWAPNGQKAAQTIDGRRCNLCQHEPNNKGKQKHICYDVVSWIYVHNCIIHFPIHIVPRYISSSSWQGNDGWHDIFPYVSSKEGKDQRDAKRHNWHVSLNFLFLFLSFPIWKVTRASLHCKRMSNSKEIKQKEEDPW